MVDLVGDGAFNFDSPIGALWAANVYHAPFLTIVFNNKQLHAVKSGIWGHYGRESFLEKAGWPGARIEPSPDYALISQACGNYGQTVEDPSELQPALRDALDQVRRGRPALLDVRIETE